MTDGPVRLLLLLLTNLTPTSLELMKDARQQPSFQSLHQCHRNDASLRLASPQFASHSVDFTSSAL